jgi:Serpentine type 7TM GPCR chemoreceptor Str
VVVCLLTALASDTSEASLVHARSVFNSDEAPYIVSCLTSGLLSVANSTALIYVILAYSAIVYYTVRTWLHMRKMVALVDGAAAQSKLRGANRQVSAVLLLQAISPIVLGGALGVYTSFLLSVTQASAAGLTAQASADSLMAQSLLTVTLNWLPAANGLFPLLVIRSYRRELLLRVVPCWGKRQQSPVTVVKAASSISP